MNYLTKILALTIFTFITINSVRAQKFGRKSKTIFGVKLGINKANQTFSNDFGPGDENYKLMTGFHLGATAEKFFGRIFSVETDLLYSTKGHKYISEDVYPGGITVSQNNKRVISYLEIPIQFKASQQLGDNSLAFIAFGPYLAYAINGVWVYYVEETGFPTYDETEDIKFGSNNGDTYRRTDWGIQLNVGTEIGPLQVSAGYQWGLSNIDGERAAGAKHTNRIIKVSLGYRFIR